MPPLAPWALLRNGSLPVILPARVRAWVGSVGLAVGLCGVMPASAQPAGAPPLPPEVEAALARAKLPRESLSVLVADAQGGARTPPRLAHRAQVPVNPASVMKLVTTYAALEQLGPAYTWSTPVFVEGTVQGGSLKGNVYIQGQGDPKLVVERLWLLMRRLQAQGIQVIVGDIVLDRSAFDVPEQDPGPFRWSALAPLQRIARRAAAQLQVQRDDLCARRACRARPHPVRPAAGWGAAPGHGGFGPAGADCGDWRGALRAELNDPLKVVFQGAYPAACGERVWPVAYPAPREFAARAVEGMWRELGGELTGSVREGEVPAGLKPAFVSTSPALAEVVRDVNKYSNNVMAQHVFLTLARQKNGVATLDGARETLRQWWQARFADVDAPAPDNGAGLSRDARITAQALARMLQAAWASPVMPELVASLPIAGVDGTLRRSQSRSAAHLKTGSLRDVMAVAGYVHAQSGRRYVLVAIVNHPNANAARPVLDALTDWAAKD